MGELLGMLLRVVFVIAVMLHLEMTSSCLEQERIGLLGLRQLLESNGLDSSKHLPGWRENSERDCCDWERVKCDNATSHVTELFLWNLKDTQSKNEADLLYHDVWTINFSLFLPFPELRSLNLSLNSFAEWEMNHGFERLSALKKLEILDLSNNNFHDITIFHYLGAVTSLKELLLSGNMIGGPFPAHELAGLINLETLDLTNVLYDVSPKQGFEKLGVFKKLKTLNLGYCGLTVEILPYLNSFTSLTVLNLRSNQFMESFPAQELGNLKNLERLDLGENGLTEIRGFERLGKFNKLTSLDVSWNMFNSSFIWFLSPLTSLKNLSLAYNQLEDPFPARELSNLQELEMLDLSHNNLSSLTVRDCELLSALNKMRHLDLSYNSFQKAVLGILGVIPSLRYLSLNVNNLEGPLSNLDLTYNLSGLEVLLLNGNSLNGSLPVEGKNFLGVASSEVLSLNCLASLRFLQVLDLKENFFFGSIPQSIGALSSLKVLSLASNQLNGSLPDPGFCELTQLEELDLSTNLLQGTLPPCIRNLKSLRLFHVASNHFTGNLSFLGSLTSLEYIDLSNNLFEGTLTFSSLANHSNLVVFEIISYNGKLVVETEDTDWSPTFQLKVLVLKNCNLNKLSSNRIPNFLLNQHMLRALDLSENNLNDSFPNWLLVNNTALDVFNVHRNSLFGSLYLPSVHNTDILDFSDNRLNGEIQANIGTMLPSISLLNLSRNGFQGGIPSSLAEISLLESLDLSSNNLSGEVPTQLLRNLTSLSSLSLSNNSLQGQIFMAGLNLTQLRILQLADNRFSGPLELSVFSPGFAYLDVSNNHFSGSLSKLNISSIITTLDTVILRSNCFVGEFPCSLVPAEFMDISDNSFSGPISSCSNENLQILKHLHLQGNKFTGLIPEAFLNSSDLLTLDISNNSFSGTIPMFLAPSSELRILLAGENLLNGPIPSHFCQLNKISLMDLSNNLLSGSIPRCLKNIMFGVTIGYDSAFFEYSIFNHYDTPLYSYDGILTYDLESRNEFSIISKREEVNFVTKSRSQSYQGNILNYMSGLDLSCNMLTGEIPSELGELSSIRALNLSHNHLTGPIPKSLSNLKQVESLDLSYNQLSGNIPMELANLFYLSDFSVARNNLSGIIPYEKGQFSTFNASSYEGNAGLCGLPLEKSCKTEIPTDFSDENWFSGDLVLIAAIFGAAYITFLAGTLTIIFVNPKWRQWWFDLVDSCLVSCYFYFVNRCKKISKMIYLENKLRH